METKEKKSTIIFFRVLLFLIFSTSAGLKLLVGFENFEIAFIENKVIGTWMSAMYVINLVVILEVSCAVMALFGRFKPLQMATNFFVIVLYAISLFTSINSIYFQDYTLLYFGNFFVNIAFLSMVTLLFIRLKQLNNKEKIILKWPFQLLIIATISSAYLFLGSINFYQFELKTEPYKSGVANWSSFEEALLQQQPALVNEELLIAFFSTECSHCQEFAKKLTFTNEMHPKRKILMVFWSNEAEINVFKEKTGAIAPYIILNQASIMNIVGMAFPVFFEYKNGKATMQYSGTEMSYRVIDKLFKE